MIAHACIPHRCLTMQVREHACPSVLLILPPPHATHTPGSSRTLFNPAKDGPKEAELVELRVFVRKASEG